MAEITAAAVRQLRDKTGLPMMDCKNALNASGGDEAGAIDWLRKNAQAKFETRTDRETAFGRFGIHSGSDKTVGAMVELKCESAPVAGSPDFIAFLDDIVAALVKSDKTPANVDELLALPSTKHPGKSLADVKLDLFNRIREVFNVGRFKKIQSASGGYSHNAGTVSGVLLEIEGGNDAAAKDVCMHVAAMRPIALDKDAVDPAIVEKERQALKEAALKEGKPANIVDKMVEGRLRNFYAERVLTEQPFVKDDKQTVGKFAESHKMKLKGFTHWELGVG